uniref:Uncharacterized protein n=3 Tax=Schistocephalus solidus TaxID=70667 RepID=A0A0X3NQ92_SCHSO
MSVTADSSPIAFLEDVNCASNHITQLLDTEVKALSDIFDEKVKNLFLFHLSPNGDNTSDDEDHDTSLESAAGGLKEQFSSLVTLTEKVARVNQLSAKLSQVRKQIEEKRRCLTDMYSPYIKLDHCNGSPTAFKGALQFLVDQKSLELSASLREVSISKQRCDSERLASELENRRSFNLSDAISSPEFEENRTLDEIQKARVGHVERVDNSHLLLDVSKSSLFPTLAGRSDNFSMPTSPGTIDSTDGLSTRFHTRIITEKGLPYQRLDEIHPLCGNPSTMQLARLASDSLVPSLVSNAMLWQYVAQANEQELNIPRETD